MKRLIALTLSAILLLTGCSSPAAPQAGNDSTSDNNLSQPDFSVPLPSPDPSQGSITGSGGAGGVSSGTPDINELPEQSIGTPGVGSGSAGGAVSSPTDIPVILTLDDYLGDEYADTEQVMLVTVKTADATAAVVKTLDKTDGSWKTNVMTIGYVGEKGCVDGAERVQGSLKTPMGIYRIIGAMGISADPGAKFPYTRITDGMYWDLNSGSATYNRLINSDPGGSREVLYQMGKQYDYILNTSYNYDQTEHKGGAIFIHVSQSEPTAGCVSVPRSDMEKIIKWADPAKNPVVIICLSDTAPIV